MYQSSMQDEMVSDKCSGENERYCNASEALTETNSEGATVLAFNAGCAQSRRA